MHFKLAHPRGAHVQCACKTTPQDGLGGDNDHNKSKTTDRKYGSYHQRRPEGLIPTRCLHSERRHQYCCLYVLTYGWYAPATWSHYVYSPFLLLSNTTTSERARPLTVDGWHLWLAHCHTYVLTYGWYAPARGPNTVRGALNGAGMFQTKIPALFGTSALLRVANNTDIGNIRDLIWPQYSL